ncbi:MAG: hypothetical protein ACK4EZ_02060 [Fervidobacterium pennivorans]|uniref:Uncharacterized protein n=2 Tax=Fervidobacterium TaxID=2422 RepID=A0AAI8CKX2_FERIS|nr:MULTISPECIES: hypothetical protein [Fervidobacterium]AMW32395.1 hypothetical protein NA23_03180 [Fervidobacterium islandicum]QAV34024.1 hypothetical protein CBS1_10180 [Fervidobacterium changbaicum]SDH37592.1 hypothetical protein SAMN04488510_11214 [Fervidobacterium changbaicum]
MGAETIILKLDSERNKKLDEIISRTKEILSQVRKIKLYLLAGFYGFYLSERRVSNGDKVDVSRGEFLEKDEYKDFQKYIAAIYELTSKNDAEGSEKKSSKDMYAVFEEFVNTGVDELYNLLQNCKSSEEFLEELELRIQEAYESLGFESLEQEEIDYGNE